MSITPYVYTGHGLPEKVVADIRVVLANTSLTAVSLERAVYMKLKSYIPEVQRVQQYANASPENLQKLQDYLQDYDRIEQAEHLIHEYMRHYITVADSKEAEQVAYAKGATWGIYNTLEAMGFRIAGINYDAVDKERG